MKRKRPKRKNYRRLGKIQQKILLLLSAGLATGLNQNPMKQELIFEKLEEEWEKVSAQTVNRSIRALYEARFIHKKIHSYGNAEITLSTDGSKWVMVNNLDKLSIQKPKKWDGYFWVVLFDIPEKRKRIRDALRFHLKKIGFYELQKSVFVFPFQCMKEIKFLAEYYNIRKHIRVVEARSIDQEKEFIDHFKLSV